MPEPKPRNLDALPEPMPRYPSNADIAAAERLRHRLEQQYFAAPPSTSAAAKPTSEEH